MRLFAVIVTLSALIMPARAADVTVAVATNFSEVIEHLAEDFEARTSNEVRVSPGSTGALYAQVRKGAPYDILLAADERRPRLLETEGYAVPGSRFTYAIGRLALWSADPGRIKGEGPATLSSGDFNKLAIANPELAPYGMAAKEVLQQLGLLAAVEQKLVMGANIGQTHAMVATGNAELGFVALSYLLSPRNRQTGSRWEVPADYHEPIRQDAVLLKRGADNKTARAFIDYLKSDDARAVIGRYGYLTDRTDHQHQ